MNWTSVIMICIGLIYYLRVCIIIILVQAKLMYTFIAQKELDYYKCDDEYFAV